MFQQLFLMINLLILPKIPKVEIINYGFIQEYITCDDAELYEYVSYIFEFKKYFHQKDKIIEDSKKTFLERNAYECRNFEIKKYDLISNADYVKIYQQWKLSIERNAIRVDYSWY